MELSEIQNRVAELEQQISNLPAGSITKKTVNGKEYFYHRWTEDKKRKEKYIPVDESEATADVSVSSNCMIMSMVIHRIKYSFFTVCAGQEKPP